MSERDNGGPAFPVECSTDYIDNGHQTGNRLFQQYGMALRDYFAAKAMAAYIQRDNWSPQDPLIEELGFDDLIAKYAYEAADAMLKARQQ